MVDAKKESPDGQVDSLISSETGRLDHNSLPGKVVWCTLLVWSAFQLWYASPLPYAFNFLVLNEDQAKYVHLAFALFLSFNLFYDYSQKPHKFKPYLRLLLGLVAIVPVLYMLIFKDDVSSRAGNPTSADVIFAMSGIFFLLIATRKALGLPLLIVGIVFLLFSVLGPYMPDVISHKGASINALASHQFLTSEGIFGVALGVSTTFVFLFVLLGAFLDVAGAGNFFIKLSFSMLGHFRGGPAKASVVASGLSGIVSGSSIANVVTTGTFTIPLMKRVGFSGEKAGAIEVAASTNGQLTPPIMGAAAFLMVEYIGIPYIDVIKHAILPALVSYIALLFIVHLEATKLKIEGIKRDYTPTVSERLLSYCTSIVGILGLGAAVYYITTWLEAALGASSYWVMSALLIAAYILLVRLSAKYPDLEIDDPKAPILTLPDTKKTLYAGLYFLIPIVVLLWALTVKRFSPPQSAFFSLLFLIFIVISHKPLKSFFRGESDWLAGLKVGFNDFLEGMVNGSRNMIGIAIATAAAGIIVGTVTLTGLGQMMTAFVEFISAGNLLLVLLFTAVICIVLGMGLPTTANYIVVSSLMAPVIVTLAADNGLVVPLIAAHLFVFYFGILADDTPPVGLAAFAAAAISGADSVRTGVQGFIYDIRTAVLPFMFIFNTKLLLIGIESVFDLLLTIAGTVVAILSFSAATQGFWLVKNKLWETALLLFITFALFRPDFWMDMIEEPYQAFPAAGHLEAVIKASAPKDYLRIQVQGMSLEGDEVDRIVSLAIPDAKTVEGRLQEMGLTLSTSNDEVKVDSVMFGSPAQKVGVDFDWTISQVFKPSDRIANEWLFLPALFLLWFVGYLQSRRRDQL
ncbi:MAG: TRAP transporter permease [Cellvibrionaceae bacterium]